MAYDKKDEVTRLAGKYNPEGAEKEARDWVYKRKYAMENSPSRREAEKNWDKWQSQWEQLRRPKDQDDWQSNHVVPLTTSIVETVLSEVIDQSPKPVIMPRSPEDAPKARVMQRIFEYTWEVSDGDLELYNVLKDAFILGTGIAQEFYWKESRMVTNEKGKEELVYDFDDCYMEAVRLQDFYVDEKARGFMGPYQARDCVRRYIMDIDDFRLYFQGETWDPLKNAKYVVPGGDVDYFEDWKPPQGIDTGRDVEVLWYWSRKPKDCLWIGANGVLIVKGPNPFRHKQLPFARAVDIKRTHQFYGKGESELLESVQDELNTIRQMMLDRAHLDIDKMFFVSPYMNLSDEDLIARPHGAIPIDNPELAKPIEYGDTPRSTELQLKHLEDDSVIVTGVNPRAQALPTTGTATEAAILKESTLKRIRLKMKLIEKETLTPIGRMRVANILQYYSQPKLDKIVGEANIKQFEADIEELKARGIVENINGEDYVKRFRQVRTQDTELSFNVKGQPVEKANPGYHFFELKPEYFMPVASGGYDIKFMAGSTLPVSKSLLKQETLEMYDRLIQIAMAMPETYDIKKLGDELIRVNDRNPQDFYAEKVEEDNQRLEMQIEMANLENQQMMQGKPVEATPYANPAHTQLHVEFTGSDAFQGLSSTDPRLDIFNSHITGEAMAQESRAGGPMANDEMMGATAPGGSAGSLMPGTGINQPSAAAGGANRKLSATQGAKIQGGGMVTKGQQAS